ncbi:glutamate--tRNA ligase [Candidatus Sumerlaeota bacterium]|nr:glutamate--tRNA ligase [Candidatus Sumerlaeota bacterium]
MSEVRVRFAPAPTGELHIGNVRTALFDWLFVRHHGGAFILRIEDTDRERSRQEWADQIIDLLQWLGLCWDEGPYYQSQRIGLHQEMGARLVELGHAYPCFCSSERLEGLRLEASRQSRPFIYDRHCLNLPREEVEQRIRAGERHVIRFRVADSGVTSYNDLVYGPKEFENHLMGDFVIVRSDGAPTFLLSCAVDDHDMAITHVIRGDDHISNTPKQILIMRALGWEPPQYAHLPLICGPDRAPLSKRHGATAFAHYRDHGYLSEALMNYLALLGWAYDDATQVFSREELIEKFSIERVSRSPAVFDREKLLWMNGYYIRNLPPEVMRARVREWLDRCGFETGRFDQQWLDGIIGLEIERSKTLEDFAAHLAYLLRDELEYNQKAVDKHLKRPKAAEVLRAVRSALADAPDFRSETIEPLLRTLSEHMQLSFAAIAQPMRVALTGVDASPPIFDVLFYLGRQRVLERIDHALAHLV